MHNTSIRSTMIGHGWTPVSTTGYPPAYQLDMNDGTTLEIIDDDICHERFIAVQFLTDERHQAYEGRGEVINIMAGRSLEELLIRVGAIYQPAIKEGEWHWA